jgi:outer membrane protein assembly factor BamB
MRICIPRFTVTFILIAMLVPLTRVTAADWARFRGPNGAGISEATTIPTEWTEDDYNWVADLPGEGHGSPVVVGDNIFLLCGDPFTAERRVVCINANDGKFNWVKRFKSARHIVHRDNNYASSTPVADATGVVAVWTTPKTFIVIALDNAGKEMWKHDFGEYKAVWGGAPSPIMVDDVVIVVNDQMDPNYTARLLPEGTPITAPGNSFVIALDRTTGETRWKVERNSLVAGYSVPCVRELSGGKKEVVITAAGNGITAIDTATGEINWAMSELYPQRTVMAPVLADDLIVGSYGIGLTGDKLLAVRPPSDEKGEPELVYEVEKSIPLVPSALHKDGLIFMTCETGIVCCVNAADGKVIWRERVRGKFYASPVWIDGRLFCVDRRGDVIILKAGDKFEQLARNPLGDDCFATPAVANGAIYFRTATQLMSLGGETKR